MEAANVGPFSGGPAKGRSRNKKIAAYGPSTKNDFIALCGLKRRNERIRQAEDEARGVRDEIRECQRRLVSLIRQQEEITSDLAQLKGKRDAPPSRYADEFDQLVTHPDLVSLEVSGNLIIAHTKEILISYRGRDYRIGEFKITINTENEDASVRMINQTRKIDGYNHPHIGSGGVPCLGNIQESLPPMIAGHHYAAVIAVCIQYLKSYTNSGEYSAYSYIGDWPLVETEKNNGRTKAKGVRT